MKQTTRLVLAMVLLLAATGINAENYHGTMERFGDKLHYTFSGGPVTGKGKGGIIEEYDDMMTAFEMKWNPKKGKTTFSQAFVETYNVKETVVITPDNYLDWLT